MHQNELPVSDWLLECQWQHGNMSSQSRESIVTACKPEKTICILVFQHKPYYSVLHPVFIMVIYMWVSPSKFQTLCRVFKFTQVTIPPWHQNTLSCDWFPQPLRISKLNPSDQKSSFPMERWVFTPCLLTKCFLMVTMSPFGSRLEEKNLLCFSQHFEAQKWNRFIATAGSYVAPWIAKWWLSYRSWWFFSKTWLANQTKVTYFLLRNQEWSKEVVIFAHGLGLVLDIAGSESNILRVRGSLSGSELKLRFWIWVFPKIRVPPNHPF